MFARTGRPRSLSTLCLVALSPVPLLLFYVLPPASTVPVQLVDNCDFRSWEDGNPT